MGAKMSRVDFEWTYTDEPHATRRKEILKKYPEIKKLMGCDPKFKYIVSGLVLIQLVSFWFLRDVSIPKLLIIAYFFGGIINHALEVAIHDIAHNLAFGYSKPKLNWWFGIFTNLPLGFPAFVTYKKYHAEHHRYQGDEVMDIDVPTELEAKLFRTTFTKLLWVLLMPLFITFRCYYLYPKPITFMDVANAVIQLTFNAVVWYFCGFRILFYMIASSFLPMSLHPIAGHFITEHYMVQKGYETYSYYGPANYITFNVGYHTEHHDFPSIPASRLPQVKKIASEYYENIPHHTSLIKAMWNFITDPTMGPTARVKRKTKRKD